MYGIHSYTLFTHFGRLTASKSIPISRKTPKTGALERSRTSEFLEKRCKKNQPNFFFILKYSKTCFHFVFHLYSVTTHVFHHHVQFSCSYQHSVFLMSFQLHSYAIQPSMTGFLAVVGVCWLVFLLLQSLSGHFHQVLQLFSTFSLVSSHCNTKYYPSSHAWMKKLCKNNVY